MWGDRMWDPKVYPHSFQGEFHSGFCYDILLACCHNCHLWKPVDNHKNTVVSMLSRRKAWHVIYGDGFPRLARGRQQGIEALLLAGWFGNDTGSAWSDVLPKIMSKIRPIEILLQYYHHFLDLEMPNSLTIMCFPNHWPFRLMEHKGDPSGITGHPRGENIRHANPPRVSSMCGQILGHFCREVANQKSRAHKSWARWLTPWSVVDWGNLQYYWCCPSYTWYSSGNVVGMWTTFDGDHSIISLVSV